MAMARVPVLSRRLPRRRHHGRSLETLAFDEIRSPTPPTTTGSGAPAPQAATALVLHGLLGSARNWRSFSRNLASNLRSRNPTVEWRMILVDLRNHGKSSEIKGLKPPHDLVSTARDLADLVEKKIHTWPDVVIGHSLGGKVAMQYASSCAHGEYGKSAVLPTQHGREVGRLDRLKPNVIGHVREQLWVLDSVPGEISEDADADVKRVLEKLSSLPLSFPSQRWVVDEMMSSGFTKSFSEWIASNVKNTGSGGTVTWSFDLQAAIQMFNSYRERSYWPLLERPPDGLEVAVVRADQSDRWDPPTVEKLEALAAEGRKRSSAEGRVVQYVLPKSGHWVHVDNPKGLLQIVAANFASPALH